MEIDPIYLEVLHYTRQEKIEGIEDEEVNLLEVIGGGGSKKDYETHSALHAAFKDGNNRVVDSILQKMSDISTDYSEMFSDLLPELTDLQSFTIYTGNLPTQTS